MKNFDVAALGVEELSLTEMCQTDGGKNIFVRFFEAVHTLVEAWRSDTWGPKGDPEGDGRW